MTGPLWLIPALPLAGFALNRFMGRRLSRWAVGGVACASVGLAFLAALGAIRGLVLLSPEARVIRIRQPVYSWIGTGDFQVAVGPLLDPLSALMILVVTGVGFLIHLYSVGYMHEDPDYSRYFAQLNLFVFFMLLLVLADNYLLLFVGWEGVGCTSYMLIGFWFEREAAARAGLKAFIVNRVGDAGSLALLILVRTFGTLDYVPIFDRAPALLQSGRGLAIAITLLLFLGAVVLLKQMRPGGIPGTLVDLLDPIVSRPMGPHINRRTLENIRKADLIPAEERNVFSDWIKLVVARDAGPDELPAAKTLWNWRRRCRSMGQERERRDDGRMVGPVVREEVLVERSAVRRRSRASPCTDDPVKRAITQGLDPDGKPRRFLFSIQRSSLSGNNRTKRRRGHGGASGIFEELTGTTRRAQREERSMMYIVETKKDVETAARDLEEAVKRNKFGVLHVHNLKQTLKEKGIDFPNACKILEVCNPQQANKVLTANMAVNMALPCRISVYQEGGKTKIGTIRPTALLAMFPNAADLKSVAEEVEQQTIRMIDEAR